MSGTMSYAHTYFVHQYVHAMYVWNSRLPIHHFERKNNLNIVEHAYREEQQ